MGKIGGKRGEKKGEKGRISGLDLVYFMSDPQIPQWTSDPSTNEALPFCYTRLGQNHLKNIHQGKKKKKKKLLNFMASVRKCKKWWEKKRENSGKIEENDRKKVEKIEKRKEPNKEQKKSEGSLKKMIYNKFFDFFRVFKME